MFIDGQPVHRTFVKEVVLERKPKNHVPGTRTMMVIGPGLPLLVPDSPSANKLR